MTPKKKATRGRPDKGMKKVLYLRVSDEIEARLRERCEQSERETGLPVSVSDMARKLLSDSLMKPKG